MGCDDVPAGGGELVDLARNFDRCLVNTPVDGENGVLGLGALLEVRRVLKGMKAGLKDDIR